MFTKTLTLVAGAAGYVLGARAGRERFNQIKEQADRLRSNPTAQKAASDAQDVVAEKAPVVKDKLVSKARRSNDGGSTGSDVVPPTATNPSTAKSPAESSAPKHSQANV